MKKAFYSFSILIFILTACSAPAEPKPTAEPTNTPESTPEPVYLEGILFFDKNATGLQDEATYLPCTNQSCDAVSEMEPGLEGFEVCTNIGGQEYCSITQSDGSFSIELPSEQSGLLHVDISNPEGISIEDEISWINIFNNVVTIPAYTLKGKEGWNIINGVPTEGILNPNVFYQGDVPEQTLYDTDSITLNKGIDLKVREDNSVGLMKGTIVYPFRVEDFNLLNVRGGADHNPSNEVIDFAGNTQAAYESGNLYLDCILDENSDSPFICSYNDHIAHDYGYKGSPMGIPIFAANDGFLVVEKDKGGSINIIIWPTKQGLAEDGTPFQLDNNPDNHVELLFSHCDSATIGNYEYVYRGQLIGFMGNTGTMVNYSHLHFGAKYGIPFEEKQSKISTKYSKDFYAMTVLEFIEEGFNDLSVWTDWNQPIFYPINFELEWTP